MRETERYLNRATRGLWGRKRRDALLELRGAIEDKVYRWRLLGLDEAQATRAALRDLGSPHAIARDLNRVHTLPHAARAALLAGVATLLGVQALAQVPTVSAASSASVLPCKLEAAAVEALLRHAPSEAMREGLRAELAKPGGRERLEAECRANPAAPNDLLRLSDLIAALRAGGVGVETLTGTDAFLNLRFPGSSEPQPLNLNDFTHRIGGEWYINVGTLLGQLRYVLKAPIQLTGRKNPTLTIGPARMQLGTAARPIYSTDLYASIIWDRLSMELQLAAPDPSELREMVSYPETGGASIPALSFPVSGAEDTVYAIVYGQTSTDRAAPSFALRAARGGRVEFPTIWWSGRQPTLPRVVKSLPEFFQARAKGQPVALLYQVDTSDLRDLKLVPVSAAQPRLRTAP